MWIGAHMKLYSGPLSLYSRKVEIALAEKGLAFERVMVPFTQTQGYHPKHPDVLAANPKGQVPVLKDGDLTLFDSTLILEYLEEAYPTPPLYPKEPKDKARCRLLELMADDVLIQPVRQLMYRTEPPHPDAARQRQREVDAKGAEREIEKNHRMLEARLKGHDYFCGDFSVADITIFLVVLYSIRLRGPGPENCPELSAWYDRIAARSTVGKIIEEIAAADRELSPELRP